MTRGRPALKARGQREVQKRRNAKNGPTVKDSSTLVTAHNETVARVEADSHGGRLARWPADKEDGRVPDAVEEKTGRFSLRLSSRA